MSESNFWNTCPRKLEYRPESPCAYACEWIISSSINNNCFWTYVHNNSRSDGTMKPLQPNEIAKLLGITTSQANDAILIAECEMRNILSGSDLKLDPESPSEDIGPLIMPEEELEDQDAFDIIIEDV